MYYVQEALSRDRHQERLSKAQEARAGHQAAELGRLVRRQARAERQLLLAWQRADRMRSILETG